MKQAQNRVGWRWALFLCLMPVMAWASVALSAEKPQKERDREVPLHITAARLEADQKERAILFSGDVKAQYGDSILYAEQLWVYYQPGPGPAAPTAGAAPAPPGKKTEDPSPLGDLGGEKIDRIVARGQVRFVQEDKVATGQEAVYYKNREEVVLTGRPQVWRGENNLKGERIVVHLRTNRVTVESSAQQRVEAHIYPATKGAAGAKLSLPGVKGKKERKP